MRYLIALLLSALTACGVELTNVPPGTPTVNSKLLGTPGTSAKLYSVSDILALSTNVPPLPAGVLTNNSTNVTLSGTFSGNGAGLTNVSTTVTNYSRGIFLTNVTLVGDRSVDGNRFVFTNMPPRGVGGSNSFYMWSPPTTNFSGITWQDPTGNGADIYYWPSHAGNAGELLVESDGTIAIIAPGIQHGLKYAPYPQFEYLRANCSTPWPGATNLVPGEAIGFEAAFWTNNGWALAGSGDVSYFKKPAIIFDAMDAAGNGAWRFYRKADLEVGPLSGWSLSEETFRVQVGPQPKVSVFGDFSVSSNVTVQGRSGVSTNYTLSNGDAMQYTAGLFTGIVPRTNYVWDTNALLYCQLSGVASNSAAGVSVSELSKWAKASGWWTNCDVILPFRGTDLAACAWNLRTNEWHLTNIAAHAAAWHPYGVQFDGSTAYVDTGFKPSTHASRSIAGMGLNSIHLGVYVHGQTNSLDATRYGLLGCVDVSANYTILRYQGVSGNSWMNEAAGTASTVTDSGNDVRGMWLGTRTGAASKYFQIRSLADSATQSSAVALPAVNFYLGAENNGGFYKPFGGVISGVTFGGGMPTNIVSQYIADWNAFVTTDWDSYYWGITNTVAVIGNATLGGTNTWTGPTNNFTGQLLVNGVPVRTNLSTVTLTNNMPVVVVSSKGVANGLSAVANDGYPFGPDTPGTTTCGIQEAMNSLPISLTNRWDGKSGGTVQLGPGIFYTTTGIIAPTCSNGFHMTLQGPGIVAGGITYIGATPSYTIKFGPGNAHSGNYEGNGSSVYSVRDLWIANNNNFTTNVAWCDAKYSGIGAITFDAVWFGYWYTMTNNSNPKIFTPSQDSTTDTTKHNLIGLWVNMEGNNWLWVRSCEFSYCLVGLSVYADHITIENNYFSMCGENYGPAGGAPNDWNWNTLWKIGGNICLHRPVPDTSAMRPHSFRVYGNNHQWAYGYSPAYLVDDTRYQNWAGGLTPWVFEKDGFEVDPEHDHIMAATITNRCTFLNPTHYYTMNAAGETNTIPPLSLTMSSRFIPQTNNYSQWTNVIAGNNLVTIWDMAHNYYNGPFSFTGGAINIESLATTNHPVGGSNCVLHFDGTNMYWANP